MSETYLNIRKIFSLSVVNNLLERQSNHLMAKIQTFADEACRVSYLIRSFLVMKSRLDANDSNRM